MYTRVFFARHGAMLFVVPARVVGSQRLHQQLLQQLRQQVEHKHSRPQRARWRPQRTGAVSWQRGRDADQRGGPHPRALAAAEERHRVGELAAHVRQGSAAVAAVAAVAERRAVPRDEQPHACISGARRGELAGSTAVCAAVRTEGVRHTLGSRARACGHLHVPRVAAGRLAVERERQQDLRAVAFAPRVNPHARGRLGQLPRCAAQRT